jgi:4'-phosphopantetheinyl transferase
MWGVRDASGVADRQVGGPIEVWHARTSEALADAAGVERALTWLSASERARFDRYRHDADRGMFLLGRVMARTLVGRALGVAPHAWSWGEGPRGRPSIAKPDTSLSFNLAHSAGLVVCALSTDGDVGVDVEYRQRPPIDARMIRRYCAPDEAADIERRGPDGWRDQFLKYWTLKEAYLKARGLGIAMPLADLCFTLGDDGISLECRNAEPDGCAGWTFLLAESEDTHFLAAAARTAAAPHAFAVSPFPLDHWP